MPLPHYCFSWPAEVKLASLKFLYVLHFLLLSIIFSTIQNSIHAVHFLLIVCLFPQKYISCWWEIFFYVHCSIPKAKKSHSISVYEWNKRMPSQVRVWLLCSVSQSIVFCLDSRAFGGFYLWGLLEDFAICHSVADLTSDWKFELNIIYQSYLLPPHSLWLLPI